MRRKFKVTNMMCASCVSHVQKAVERLSGVVKVEVNLLTESMVVEYDENLLNDKTIIDAVLKENYGCSIYKREIKVDNSDLFKMKRRIIISSIFLVLLLYVSMGPMIHLPLPSVFIEYENTLYFAIAQIVLVLPIVILNFSYFTVGFKKLFSLKPNMDSLIALGATASILYGIYKTILIIIATISKDVASLEIYHHELYFESAGTILTLITIGKYLENRSKKRTTESLEKIMALTPKTSLIEVDNKEVEIAQEEIRLNDTVIIKMGMVVPVDGTIFYGNASLDEAIITGESMPVEKKANDKVVAGSKVLNGYIKIKAESINGETTIDRILDLVEEAASSKAPISRLADKISAVFVPIVMGISLICLTIWLIVGDESMALNTFISVLVISCPCALGLATPVAIMVATGKAAENNILIKSAESLELCHKINTIVLDKTGTITKGKMIVDKIISPKEGFMEVLYSLEKLSTHPLSVAVNEYAVNNNTSFFSIDKIENVPLLGLEGFKGTDVFLAGNKDLMKKHQIPLKTEIEEEVNSILSEGKTVIYVAKNNELLGVISLKDEIRENSKTAIEYFKKQNIEVVMATGDNEATASSIGKEIGINKVFSKINPEGKSQIIKDLKTKGEIIAFVGDGINDAVALTTADVGIAIGTGTDVATSSADIILPKNDLLDVAMLLLISKKTINNIKMNLFWAFFYNSIGILIATGIFYPLFELKLNPMIASLAMSLSSFSVVMNALRLKLIKNKEEKI